MQKRKIMTYLIQIMHYSQGKFLEKGGVSIQCSGGNIYFTLKKKYNFNY